MMQQRVWLSLAMIGVLAAATAQALSLGDKAPKTDVKMKNVDGKELSIADVKGEKGTLVIFSCNHCPFAKGWEARISSLGNEYRKKGIGVIQINSNDPVANAEDAFDAMQERAKQRGFEFPYVVDATSGVAREFGATRTPEAFLFDADGKLVYHGAVDDNHKSAEIAKEHYLKDALESLSGGKGIAVKETKAVGCGIKFRS